MKNDLFEKGFTLVELLAVIVVLSLIIVVVSTNGFGLFDNTKSAINEQNLKTIKEGANFLMNEVKYCDDEFDSQLVESVIGNGKKCSDLKAKANISNGCLEITLQYLWENKYVTNSGIEDIYINNPDYTLWGCLNSTDDISIKTEDEIDLVTTTTTKMATTIKTTTTSLANDFHWDDEMCFIDGYQLDCDTNRNGTYTKEQIENGITCGVITRGVDNHIFESLDFMVLKDDGSKITLIKKEPIGIFSGPTTCSSVYHRLHCYDKNFDGSFVKNSSYYSDDVCNITLNNTATNDDSDYPVVILKWLYNLTKDWYMIDNFSYTGYFQNFQNGSSSQYEGGNSYENINNNYVKLSQTDVKARLPFNEELVLKPNTFSKEFVLNDAFIVTQGGYIIATNPLMPEYYPGGASPGVQISTGSYNANPISSIGCGAAVNVHPVIEIDAKYFKTRCNVANSCCTKGVNYYEDYNCFCTNQP